MARKRLERAGRAQWAQRSQTSARAAAGPTRSRPNDGGGGGATRCSHAQRSPCRPPRAFAIAYGIFIGWPLILRTSLGGKKRRRRFMKLAGSCRSLCHYCTLSPAHVRRVRARRELYPQARQHSRRAAHASRAGISVHKLRSGGRANPGTASSTVSALSVSLARPLALVFPQAQRAVAAAVAARQASRRPSCVCVCVSVRKFRAQLEGASAVPKFCHCKFLNESFEQAKRQRTNERAPPGRVERTEAKERAKAAHWPMTTVHWVCCIELH